MCMLGCCNQKGAFTNVTIFTGWNKNIPAGKKLQNITKNVYACPFIQIKVKQWTFHEIVAPLSGKMPDL